MQLCCEKYICYYAYHKDMKENKQNVSIKKIFFQKVYGLWLFHMICHKHFTDSWHLKAPDL